ncbi:MAG: LysE family translocator [Acidimicrobiia bacterium]
MPPLDALPVFVAASLALLVIPGPAVLYIVARSSTQGQRAGILSVLGVHTATLLHVLAAVAGLSAVVMTSSVAFTAIKTVGGAYLVYVGIRTLVGARRSDVAVEVPAKPLRRLYVDGLVVNLLNPKVALFFLAFLPQFVARGHGPVWSQTLVLGLLYIALGMLSDCTYAFIGARAGGWLRRHANVRTRGKYVEGGVLIGLGITALAAPHRQPAR